MGGIDHARVRQADAAPAAGFDECLLAMADQQHRIGRYTGLPRIKGFARQDIACGTLQIRPRQHQDRAFAAKFQRQRRQIRRGSGHDLPPCRGAAGEDQMIPGLSGEIRADVSATLHAKRDVIAPGVAQNIGNQRGGARQRFRWFHTHAIAGGNGINRGQQRQLHRVIPRRHDADHAFGDEFLPRAGGPEGIGYAHAACAHPMP